TNHGFNGEDFRYKHTLSANYYFNFKAVEVEYLGIFANVIPNWDFEVVGYYSTPSFQKNYFGYGNDSEYDKDDVGKNYNRARIKQIKLRSGISYRSIHLHALFESFKVEENPNRLFIPQNVGNDVFESQNYIGAEADLL